VAFLSKTAPPVAEEDFLETEAAQAQTNKIPTIIRYLPNNFDFFISRTDEWLTFRERALFK
jgi:hypothetical protein